MVRQLSSEEKSVLVLLLLVIFYYHGLDEEEEDRLKRLGQDIGAEVELQWAYGFVAKDYVTSFERARDWMKGAAASFEDDAKLYILQSTWDANLEKGYVTEIETTALIRIAQDWNVRQGFARLVQNG